MSAPLLHSAEQDSANLAPQQGIAQAIESFKPDTQDFAKWLKEKTSKLQDEHQKVWREQFLISTLIFFFIDGKQILTRNPRTNGWIPMDLPRRTDSPVYAYNQVGFYVDNIKARWAQSSPKIEWYPARDTDEAEGAAKAAKVVTDHYFRKYLDEQFKQGEATLAIAGNYARFIYYSDEQRGGYGKRPITGPTQIPGESSYLCADCGRMGATSEIDMGQEALPPTGGTEGTASSNPLSPGIGGADQAAMGGSIPPVGNAPPPQISSGQMGALTQDAPIGAPPMPAAPVCPGCGSPNIVQTQAQPETVESVIGEEQYEVGDVCIESVPFFELRWNISKTLEDSEWLRRKRRLRVEVLEDTFKGIKIKAKATEDTGLQSAENLRISTYGSGGRANRGSKSEEGEYADFTQWWLRPCMYTNVVVQQDVETISGAPIPAGTNLSDMFPDGMYIAWIDGVDGPCEVRNECHADMWVSGQFRQRAMTGLGIGIEDIIEPQRQFNLIMSLIYTQLRTVSSPATLYDERLFGNNVTQYLGRPDVNIPFNTTNMPENYNIDQGIKRLQGIPPSSQHYQTAQLLINQMERASRVTSSSLGQSLGLDNKTAHGAQIAQTNADTMTIPYLCLKAEVDRKTAVKVVKCFQKHCFDQRWLQISGKRGEVTGMWLKAADLSDDLMAEVVPESYLPKTNYDKQQAFQQLLLMTGGPAGFFQLEKEAPELLHQVTQALGIDLGSKDYSAVTQLCRLRIEQMKANLPMVAQTIQMMPTAQPQLDPMTGQMMMVPVDPNAEAGQMLAGSVTPPVDPFEMGHEASINRLRDWLSESEGIDADPMLRAGVDALITQHLQALMTETQIRGAIEGMAMPPAPMGPGGQPTGNQGGSPEKGSQQRRMEAGAAHPDSVKSSQGQNPNHRALPKTQGEVSAGR